MKLNGQNEVQRSNSHQVFWVIIGNLSSFSLAIVSSAILSRYFPKEEYGTFKQIVYVYSTLLIIFTAGLPQVFSYFLPRFSINEGKDIVWKISKVLFIGGMGFSIFLYFSSGLIANFLKNPQLEEGLKVFSPIPMLLLPTLGIEGIFSTYKKAFFIGIYDSITRILTLGFIVVPVIIFKGTYISAIYGWLAVSVVSLIIAYFFKGIPFIGVTHQKSKLRYKEILLYSLPLMASGIWGIGLRSADQFYISRYFGSKTFAEFSNGFIPMPFVAMVAGATSIVLTPVFSKMLHEKSSMIEVVKVWTNALLKSAIIIYPIAIFFMFFSDNIIVLLYSNAYANSAIYFNIRMILNFFTIITFTPIFLALGKTKLMARVNMILAICVWVLEFLAVLIFKSPIAVAVVSVLIGVTSVVIWMFYISTFFKISIKKMIPFGIILRIIIHTFLVAFLIKFGIRLINLKSKLIELGVSCILYIAVILYTSKFFHLNYLDFIKPFLRQNKYLKVINARFKIYKLKL